MANNGDAEQEQNPAEAQEKENSSAQEPKKVTIADTELEQLKKESMEYKDKYLRSIAEAENLRKRLHKERQEMTQMALQSILVDFLDPIDHLENALAHTHNVADEVKNWAIGFKMILNQFKEVLASNDVHPFKSVGMPFDPHNHEAIEMIETTEYPPGTVVQESIRGYKMGSKTIRPARVKVAKEPGSTTKPTEREDNEKKPINEENNPES
jgi:molecular chaperone GrpE